MVRHKTKTLTKAGRDLRSKKTPKNQKRKAGKTLERHQQRAHKK